MFGWLVLTITLTQSVSDYVRADYVVQVNVQSYSNPTNQAANRRGDCCDPGPTTGCERDRRCDNYFTFCLRALNTLSREGGCDTPEIISKVAHNDAPIDFNQPTFLGTQNPFQLNAFGPWQVSRK